MMFTPTWYLLQQEGFLAQSCLCNGLTALRQANLGDGKGRFYSAFFELSIGLERVLKLVLILDHMARQQLQPPDTKTVKNHGHKLSALFDAAKTISTARGITALDDFPDDSLPMVMLHFLNEFAHTEGRYSNINQLTKQGRQASTDPIARWGDIASQIMQTHAKPSERQHAKDAETAAEMAFGESAISLINDLDQQPLDVAALHARAAELDIAAKYAVLAMVTLVAALREVVGSLCKCVWQVQSAIVSDIGVVPDMRQFFAFASADKQYAMRKKRWP